MGNLPGTLKLQKLGYIWLYYGRGRYL
jgi:hypothetical protein